MFKVEIIREIKHLELIKDDWENLLIKSRQSNFFLTWGWNYHFIRHLLLESSLYLIIIINNEEIVGIAPLMKYKMGMLEILRFICQEHTDYYDFIIDDDARKEIFEYLINYLKKYNLYLKNIPEDSPNFEFLYKSKMFHYFAYRNPFIKINSNYSDYLKKYIRKKLLQDTNRQLKRLNELGNIKFCYVTRIEDISSTINNLIEFKSKRKYSTDVSISPFSKIKEKNFLLSVSEYMFKNNKLNIGMLIKDNEKLAIYMSFIYRNKFYYYMPSFSPEYTKYSVGRVLLQFAIEDCFRKNFDEFDFLNGEETYKSEWATENRNTYCFILVHPLILSKMIILWNSKVKNILKKNKKVFMFLLKIKFWYLDK